MCQSYSKPNVARFFRHIVVRALVVSKVEYCNSVVTGVSAHLLDRLQYVLNAAARLMFAAGKSERISPLERELH